jgi:DNA-directed RNA polymerase specialized sigma24 family protein
VSENSPTTLAELLAALPEEERFILTLYYINGRGASEIAAALGVPMRAVESVIATGKARILALITKN